MLENISKPVNEEKNTHEKKDECCCPNVKLHIDSQILLDSKDPEKIVPFLITYSDYLVDFIRNIAGYHKEFNPLEPDEKQDVVIGTINQVFIVLEKEIRQLQKQEKRIVIRCNVFVFLKKRIEECYYNEIYQSNNIIKIPSTARFHIKKYMEIDGDYYRQYGMHLSNCEIRTLVLKKNNASDEYIESIKFWAYLEGKPTTSLTIVYTEDDDDFEEYKVEDKNISVEESVESVMLWNRIAEMVSEDDDMNYKILYFYFHKGYSLMDISKLLGKHYNTVRKRYIKSLNLLKKSVDLFDEWLL